MKIKIEKGIPIPQRGVGIATVLHELKVGDSFTVVTDAKQQNYYGMA